MRLNYFFLQILFLALFSVVKPGFASGFSYYRQVNAHNSERDSRLSYNFIKKLSDKMDLLDCPIELIERQWRGSESVLKGASILQRLIAESRAPNPNYKPLLEECFKTLYDYRRMDRKDMIRARAIEGTEKDELYSQLTSTSEEDQKLMDIVASSINQETWCTTKRLAFQVGCGAALSGGGYQMNCVTPLGRRFKLVGPSIGAAIGIGATVSLPNIDSKNRISFGFKLYKRSESRLWTMTNFSSTLSAGAGIALEQDFGRRYRGYDDSAKYLCDIKPAAGLGIFSERTINLLWKKAQSPLYIKLVKAHLLDHMMKNKKVIY